MSNKKGELTRFKVKKRKINTWRLVFMVIVGLVIAYFVVSALKIVKLNDEKAEVEKQNQKLKETIEDMNQELEIINSDQYMERLARKKLKLVRSNEILFVLPNLRTNEDDEEMGPLDLAQQEAKEMVEAQRLEDAKKAEEEALNGEDSDTSDKDKSSDAESNKTSEGKDSGDKDSGEDDQNNTKDDSGANKSDQPDQTDQSGTSDGSSDGGSDG